MATSNLRIILSLRDNASRGINRAAAGIRNFQKRSRDLRLVLSQVTAVMGGMAAAGVTVKKAIDFAEEGANFIRLRDTSRAVARSMGADMDDIVDAIQDASLGTISQLDAMQAASRAMALGLGADADELANLMEVAALRGRSMGVSTTQAFNDIVTGIGRMSPLILDNLGIVIDANKTFSEYAETIGKTSGQLTGLEKRQALLNRVLQEGNTQLDEVGGLTLDNAGKWEQLQARIDDATLSMKVWLAEGLVPYLDIIDAMPDVLNATSDLLTDFLNSIGATPEALAEFAAAQEAARLAAEAIQPGLLDEKIALMELGQAASVAAEEQQKLVLGTQELTAAQLGREAMTQLNEALEEGQISQSEYDTAARTVMASLLDMTQEQIGANFALRELNQSFDDGTISTNQYLSGLQNINAELNEFIQLQEEVSQFFSEPSTSGLIPGFQFGGVVPGPIGAPRLAMVHGGETVVPPGHTFNMTINSRADSEDIQGQFNTMKAVVGGSS